MTFICQIYCITHQNDLSNLKANNFGQLHFCIIHIL
nr:MAG TPA: hypothetical protein [Caudoviricetes sp.]